MLHVGRASTALVTLILTGAVAGGGAATAQSAGLVAAYGFEELGGAAVADSSLNGNGGTIQAALRVPGRAGMGLEFDGSTSMVTIGDSPSLDLTTGMTLEAWVYPTSATQTWKDIIYKGPNDTYYLEGSSPDGSPATGGTYTALTLNGTAPLEVNAWSHLAATFDGAMIRLYVNGSQVAAQPQAGVIGTSNGPLTLGGDPLYGQHWQGLIDEVRIYNRALTAAEILSDMASPVATSPPPDTTPPTVSLVSPADGSTVTQVIQVSADADDDVGVFSVDFALDGASIGVDVSAPFALAWNTAGASNGSHTLSAVARDAAGNQATSAPVTVIIVNSGFANQVVVPGITAATTIAFLPDGRMLVGELTETIWVVQPGMNTPDETPFLQLDNSDLFGEQGLMDVLPDPNFAVNQYYYVFYTRGFPGSNNHNRVSRFTASGDGTVAGSELALWQDDIPANDEHHAGTLALGNDGKLYFTYGDQFDGSNSQRLDNYRGKVLRINLDGSTPTDNPFYDGAGPNKDQIWAYGLRNPFRMSIDSVTGRMYIGDVGDNNNGTSIEEINIGAAGANFGWPLCEGSCGLPGMRNPIFSYPHAGRDAAVMGGVVYRGTQFPPEYHGNYFFGDYVQNWIKRLVLNPDGSVAAALDFLPPDGTPDTSLVGDPVKFLEGPDGSLYYVDLGFNNSHQPNPAAIRRIQYATDLPPVAEATATPTAGPAPLQVAFSSAGSSDPEGAPLGFLWSFGDGASSTDANPVHTYVAEGSYVARLALSDGTNTSLSADLAISVGGPPVPTMDEPDDGSSFRAGDAIIFSGGAIDPDEGPLGASALSWTILFHHEGHIHPAGSLGGTTTGVLDIPTSGHDFQGDTRYEIILTATDATGLSSFTSVTVFPEKVNLTFDTEPSGLTVEIDGISKLTPLVLDSLIGFEHTIAAKAQTSQGTTYGFLSWSDGGARSHTVVTPSTDQTYVAEYTPVLSCGFGPGLALVVPGLIWLHLRVRRARLATAEASDSAGPTGR